METPPAFAAERRLKSGQVCRDCIGEVFGGQATSPFPLGNQYTEYTEKNTDFTELFLYIVFFFKSVSSAFFGVIRVLLSIPKDQGSVGRPGKDGLAVLCPIDGGDKESVVSLKFLEDLSG